VKSEKMKIWGYSERGAMNALFYGIAHSKGKETKLQLLLKEMKIEATLDELRLAEIVVEPTLSKYYGNPDAIIFYDNNIVFIEAKVSGIYNQEVENYEKEIKADKQQTLIKLLCNKIAQNINLDDDKIIEILKNKKENNNKTIGNHPVVIRLVKQIINSIKTHKKQYFVQILANSNKNQITDKFIFWKKIRKVFKCKLINLENTFLKNENDDHTLSQIYIKKK
jgi:hypothetical protein